MNIEIKLWKISNNQISPVEDSSLAVERLEDDLENWIVQSPDVLGEDLLIIGRQHSIDGVGRLDLLAINSNGELVVVELKRDLAPREAVAQALDYASWLDMTSEEEIVEIAKGYLKGSLVDAFTEHFGVSEMPVITPQNHRILLVASRLDASAERIINYLAQRYAVNMNAVYFRYAKLLPSGAEILARSVLVAESTIQQGKSARRKTTSVSELISAAEENKITKMVESFRSLALPPDEYMWELAEHTYGDPSGTGVITLKAGREWC